MKEGGKKKKLRKDMKMETTLIKSRQTKLDGNFITSTKLKNGKGTKINNIAMKNMVDRLGPNLRRI